MAYRATSDRKTSSSGSSNFESFVRKEFRGDYKIPDMEYQAYGIRSTTIWPTEQQCLRIIPGFDLQTGEVFRQNIPGKPYSKETDPAEYVSDTVCIIRTMSRLGKRRNSVITSYRPGSPEDNTWGGNTVFSEFASLIIRSVNADKEGKTPKVIPHPEWSTWVNYNPVTQNVPILSFDRETMLFQALVWELNGKPMLGSDKQPLVDPNTGAALPLLYVLGIDNGKTVEKMWTALVEPQDKTKPMDGLLNNSYKGIAEQEGSVLWLNPSSVMEGSKKRNVLTPHVSSDMSSWENTPYPLTTDQIHKWWHPWDEILNYMTPEEQLQLLVEEFDAHTVKYVIGHSGILKGLKIPDSIAMAGVGRYAALDGGKITLQSVGTMPGAAPRVNPSSPMPPFTPPVQPIQRTQQPASPVAPRPVAPTTDKVFVSPAAASPKFSQTLQGLRSVTRNNQSELQKFAQDLAGSDDDSSFEDDPFMGGGNGTV